MIKSLWRYAKIVYWLNMAFWLLIGLPIIIIGAGFAGDTAQGATKPVTVSTGLVVNTPLFVEVGDVIRIDTRSGAYITRV